MDTDKAIVTTTPAPEFGAPGSRAAWNVRLIFGTTTLILCWGVILTIVWKGTPGNSLHDSALTWSFALIAAVLLGFGVGSVIEPLLTATTGKKG